MPSERAQNDTPISAADDQTQPRDPDRILSEIRSLARAGVAASDTLMAAELRDDDHQNLYELIERLASEGLRLLRG